MIIFKILTLVVILLALIGLFKFGWQFLKELDEVYGAIFESDVRYANRGLGRTGLYDGDVFEYQWRKPSVWRVLASGLVHAALGFGVTLWLIRLTGRAMTRFIRSDLDEAVHETRKEKE